MNRSEEIVRRIVELELEHRDLDSVIVALESSAQVDAACVRRMKKRKLQLKDHISLLKVQLPLKLPPEAGESADSDRPLD